MSSTDSLLLDVDFKRELHELSTKSDRERTECLNLAYKCLQQGLPDGNISFSSDKSVDAVVYLVVESMKSGLKTSDLNDCLKSLNIGSDDLIKWYDVNQSYVRNLLLKKSEARCGIPSYRNVEWRLEAQIASRTMVNQLDPRIIVRLELSNGTHDLILTPANLIHMKEVLEEALSSSRSVHVQKLLRHVK